MFQDEWTWAPNPAADSRDSIFFAPSGLVFLAVAALGCGPEVEDLADEAAVRGAVGFPGGVMLALLAVRGHFWGRADGLRLMVDGGGLES